MNYDSKPLFLPALLAAALFGLIGCERQSVANSALPTPMAGVSVGGLARTASGDPAAAPAAPAPAPVAPVAAGPAAPAVVVPVVPVVAPTAAAVAPAPAAPAPTAVPPPAPAPTAVPAPAPSAGGVNCGQAYNHVVAANENLFRIALKYNTTVEALASANGISNVTLLRVGQNLRVTGCRRDVTPSSPGTQPAAGGYYVVKKDDNLFRIALRYNTSVEDLVSANGLSSNLIYPGQRIYLP